MKKQYHTALLKIVLLTNSNAECLKNSIEGIDENADGVWADEWE